MDFCPSKVYKIYSAGKETILSFVKQTQSRLPYSHLFLHLSPNIYYEYKVFYSEGEHYRSSYKIQGNSNVSKLFKISSTLIRNANMRGIQLSFPESTRDIF